MNCFYYYRVLIPHKNGLSIRVSKKSMVGLTLLEVLIAWALFILVLADLWRSSIESLRQTRHAYWYSVATVQLESLSEQWRAHTMNGVIIPVIPPHEMNQWNDINRQLLPHGQGYYRCHDCYCTITLQWQEKTLQQAELTIALHVFIALRERT